MPVTRHPATFRTLSAAELTTWRGTATATASDAMDRSQAMSGAIKPIKPGLSLCGQARTIQAMVGDNSALHLAVSLARPGKILAIDAGGHEDTAVWGDILTTAAIGRGIGRLVARPDVGQHLDGRRPLASPDLDVAEPDPRPQAKMGGGKPHRCVKKSVATLSSVVQTQGHLGGIVAGSR